MLRRFGLSVALRFLSECLNSRTVNWFPVPDPTTCAAGRPTGGSYSKPDFGHYGGSFQFDRDTGSYAACFRKIPLFYASQTTYSLQRHTRPHPAVTVARWNRLRARQGFRHNGQSTSRNRGSVF